MNGTMTRLLVILFCLLPIFHGEWLVGSAGASQFDSSATPRTIGGQVVQSERDEQEALFNYYFRKRNLEYETRLANLPREASVPSWRTPYSAAIHPQVSGGLSSAGSGRPVGLFRARRAAAPSGGSSVLLAYDRAFNGGQNLADGWESRRLMGTTAALLPARRLRNNSEPWEGYCSGFTASTIRHPEPIRPVDAGLVGGRPGVVLQPSDIKALLSCIYNRTTSDSFLFLAPPSARDGGPNMGTFHLTLANYIGQAEYPVGFDRAKGQVAWNNPIYAFKVDSIRDAGSDSVHQYKDVQTTVTYTYYGSDTHRQTDVSAAELVGNRRQSMTFRYRLALDDQGHIVGGRAQSGSGHFLWIPLYPVQARADGSAPGNPYVDVKKVIALARASALPELQARFDEEVIGPMIDPAVLPSPDDADDPAN
jgi:hypothetical protein